MPQLKLSLKQPEYSALLTIAIEELRNPSDQLRHILRQELGRRGLWPPPGDERRQAERKARADG